MPFINVKTNVKLSDTAKQSLMKKLTKSITIIPGKSEAHLMCAVEDGQTMMFHGDSSSPMAIVEVKILHSASKQAYGDITAELCKIMKDEAGVEGSYCYVKFDEIETWGMDGYLF